MIKRGLVSRWFVSLVGILVAILTMATGALLVAAHQGDSDTYNSDWIHACRQNHNGQLKYVGPDGTCANNEAPIHWPATQTGGPQGEQGETGPSGPPGPSGSTLVAGTPVTSVPDFEGFTSAGTLVTATATCPDGKVLLGGGAKVTPTTMDQETVPLKSSYPSSTTEWTVTAVFIKNAGNFSTVTVQAFALCSL